MDRLQASSPTTGRVTLAALALLASSACVAGNEWEAASGEAEGGADPVAEDGGGGPGPGPSEPGEPAPAPETCNGFDDDRDGAIDEGCTCAPGSSQACYSGAERTLVDGAACAMGTQLCEGSGEMGTWGSCEGEVLPSRELCGSGIDEDCDGVVDDECLCAPGETRACYGGPPGTAGVGVCREGVETCQGEGFGWSNCEGEVGPGVEVCNGLDDDCNGLVDELPDCTPCLEPGDASLTPWQVNLGEGVVGFGYEMPSHGNPAEYGYSSIPPEGDPGWAPHPAPTIDFADPSTLCGVVDCRWGGDFTYFQTFVEIAGGYAVSSLRVTMASVDDGAMVTIFNSAYPGGVIDPSSYISLGGGSTSTDLARYLVEGRNRIVVTHVDDCCRDRVLRGVTIELNGHPLEGC